MSTAHPCCNTAHVRLPPGRFVRTLRTLARWLAARAERWHAAHEARAELRALQGLSDATLRDIGMAQRRYEMPPSARDLERGLW